MRKLALVAVLAAGLLVQSVGFAQVTSVSLGLNAKIIVTGSRQDLFLRSTALMDANPNRACNISLIGSTSRIGDPSTESDKFLIRRVRVNRNYANRRVRFVYNGKSIAGTISNQSQLNLQARVKCGNLVEVASAARATNVTCTGGVRRAAFPAVLRSGVTVEFPGNGGTVVK